MPAYQQLYASNGLVAYGPSIQAPDHLFVWEANNQPAQFPDLASLLVAWNAVLPAPGQLAHRSVFFVQKFVPANLNAAFQVLRATVGALDACWGHLSYWLETDFVGKAPFSVSPSGTATFSQAGGLFLDSADLVALNSLDDFDITVTADGVSLSLVRKDVPITGWLVDGVPAVGSLVIDLSQTDSYVAGAPKVAVEWPASPDQAHPANRVAFLFSVAPSQSGGGGGPGGGGANQLVSWKSRFSDKIAPAAGQVSRGFICVDPRDNVAATSPWLNVDGKPYKEFNSRLLFDTSAVVSTTVFGVDGTRLLLSPTAAASARLGYHYDLMDANGDLESQGEVLLHPEGTFQIAQDPAPGPTPSAITNLQSTDLVAGSSPTEFFDSAAANHVEFSKGPCFLVSDAAPGQPLSLLDDKNGFARTAHIGFSSNGVPLAVGFHSQPAEGALFESVAGGSFLRRRRKALGLSKNFTPIFPLSGFQSVGGSSYEDIQGFDSTHLASYRRANLQAVVAPQGAGAAPGLGPLAITPQGLLAELAPDGLSYANLYLGNPNSLVPTPEFCLRISNQDAAIYQQVQHALAGSQLFMVFRQTPANVLQVISPSAQIHIRNFSISVAPDLAAGSAAGPLLASVFLVKLFAGKSLDDLVSRPELWALKDLLDAQNGAPGIKDLTGLGNRPPSTVVAEELQHLNSIWYDPSWQGVLALDLPVDFLPDALETLRPGVAVGKALRAHHVGLDAVRAQKGDLTTTAPMRLGSAFGLLDYTLQNGDVVAPPHTADSEPGGDPRTQRQYTFQLNKLRVSFENSQISALEAKLTVGFSHLFWAPLTPAGSPAPTLLLNGTYERRALADGSQQDVFSLVTTGAPLVVDLPVNGSPYIRQIQIAKAQLSVTSLERDSHNQVAKLSAMVSMDASLKFDDSKFNNFPIFSVKEIRVSSFGFEFDYVPTPLSFGFGFHASGISAKINFDPDQVQSLLSFLPAKVTGMSIALDKLLDIGDLHYQSLPLPGVGLNTKFQFAFLMELDFGSFGSLSGSLAGMKIPFLLGWAGGASPGLAIGIQFPGTNGKLDVGIQQFIRLQADQLNIVKCPAAGAPLNAIGIQAVNARVVFLGQRWPGSDLSFAIFIPLASQRQISWAFGLTAPSRNDTPRFYVGGGHRIAINGGIQGSFSDVLNRFQDTLDSNGANPRATVCDFVDIADPAADDWSIAAQYVGGLTIGVLLAGDMNGIQVGIPVLGVIAILYRRLNGNIGIFSIEYTLPGPMRTVQVGVASVRLPVFRAEVETDGGWLADIGYPKNNDFSVSCQVEFGIFVGSGGFLYGKTSALAVDILNFTDSFGYYAPDPNVLAKIQAMHFALAVRVGLGRSFTLGILTGEASVTIFGGIEGASGYRPGESFFNPTLFAIKGFFGLMVDVQCSVDFGIIRASARVLIYAEVGVELRRVLALDRPLGQPGGQHQLVTLPITIFAEVGITVTATVSIHIGCASVSISLSFSGVWHYEETLGGISATPFDTAGLAALPARPRLAIQAAALAPPARWPQTYRYWPGVAHPIAVYCTVLPCMASESDVGAPGAGYATCAVGAMLLSAADSAASASGLADLMRFLLAWVLIPGNPANYDTHPVALADVSAALEQIRNDSAFWDGFPAALMAVATAQFVPTWNLLSQGQADPFAVIPPWPGSSFAYVPPGGSPVTASQAMVTVQGAPMRAGDAAFAEYCRHAISGGLAEMKSMLTKDPAVSTMAWGDIWTAMQADLQ